MDSENEHEKLASRLEKRMKVLQSDASDVLHSTGVQYPGVEQILASNASLLAGGDDEAIREATARLARSVRASMSDLEGEDRSFAIEVVRPFLDSSPDERVRLLHRWIEWAGSPSRTVILLLRLRGARPTAIAQFLGATTPDVESVWSVLRDDLRRRSSP